MQLNQLEVENERLNWEYQESYQCDPNLMYTQELKWLCDYRQSILDRIVCNNKDIFNIKEGLYKYQQMYEMLSKCYYFIK